MVMDDFLNHLHFGPLLLNSQDVAVNCCHNDIAQKDFAVALKQNHLFSKITGFWLKEAGLSQELFFRL